MGGPQRVGLAGLALALVTSRLAAAEVPPCTADLAAWDAVEGELRPGARCGSYVAATNAANAPYSLAQVVRRGPVTVPYRVTLTWRRLGADPRALELGVLGGVVLVADDKVGLWVDDASFELDGWRPLPGHRVRRVHTVSVAQDAAGVVLEIDGVIAARWALRSRALTGRLAIMFKGAAGARAQAWFADLQVHGGAGQAAATRSK